MKMTGFEYGLVAHAYNRMAGELLVADASYVEPLWEATHVAVDCDDLFAEKQAKRPGLTEKLRFEQVEIANRVAAMILIQTFGIKAFDNRLWRAVA